MERSPEGAAKRRSGVEEFATSIREPRTPQLSVSAVG
jgi:hypothetical protein